ncbi:hypothetical protein [Megalodesulfovibrio gigas]|uniref:Uncharacterized protein n=1 Tax=Megalodesulfovibrio gigas (strain ATCC 19364 / DSM 1382 / NCIMB 9332 / VKM B-1759) TaxID=1121448 RepID=T2GBL7_MEGG1|nr:hypothetical protein [Megalodesulfovibrio gigas]AGW13678.1 hypothetical protein DGI_1892 [Megalodesulfovibrio gigas DSM 1382 = ATCC 19364]
MLLPEKDARFKYCPLLTTSDNKLKFCLGSQCMMFCWKHPEHRQEDDLGYCGMAEKPMGAM